MSFQLSRSRHIVVVQLIESNDAIPIRHGSVLDQSARGLTKSLNADVPRGVDALAHHGVRIG